MKTFAVTIKATVVKTVEVEAENEDEAVQEAHSQFTVAPAPDGAEKYDEETVRVEEKREPELRQYTVTLSYDTFAKNPADAVQNMLGESPHASNVAQSSYVEVFTPESGELSVAEGMLVEPKWRNA